MIEDFNIYDNEFNVFIQINWVINGKYYIFYPQGDLSMPSTLSMDIIYIRFNSATKWYMI